MTLGTSLAHVMCLVINERWLAVFALTIMDAMFSGPVFSSAEIRLKVYHAGLL